jgi:2-haloacid dehalogenase
VSLRPKALVFEVVGAVVDWRTWIARAARETAARRGLRADAEKFADASRAGYMPSMNPVRTGESPCTKLDDLHRMTACRLSHWVRIATGPA